MHSLLPRLFSSPVPRTACRNLPCAYSQLAPKSILSSNHDTAVVQESATDIVIIGGGAMGSSTAYWLKQQAKNENIKITVIEKDPTYANCSTTRSLGGVRQQFSLKENIEMSMFGAQFLREASTRLAVNNGDAPDVQFSTRGYLFLAPLSGVKQLQENYTLQKELGAKVELLMPKALKEKFPWLNCDDIELGSFGTENEGWFDPWALLSAFKQKALSLGVDYIKADVVGFENSDKLIPGLDKLFIRTESGEMKSIKFGTCVLAAGGDSGRIAAMAGIGMEGEKLSSVALPVEHRKRYVYCFHSPDGPGDNCPLVVDPSGAYFRREINSGLYLAGQSPEENEEPLANDLEVDYSFFENVVWPNIAHRVPAFQSLKIKSAWAGYYDYNSFDQNGIVGPHPHYKNLIFATGFSGHGIQQSPAVGRAIMELIMNGKYSTVDLSRFHFDRVIAGTQMLEQNIV